MRTSTDGEQILLLETEDLVAGYGGVPIVRGVSIAVKEAEVVALVGPNGAGKSTLLKALLGQAAVYAGEVTVRGWSAVHKRTEELVRRGVGYVPQVGGVFPSLTVAENLKMGAYTAPRRFGERSEVVLQLFPDLKVMLGRRAGVLSGGERTMLGIARALMTEPSLILLDEPSSGLAPRFVGAVWEKVDQLREAGIAILVVEQRARDVLAFADAGYCLVNGSVVLEGACKSWTMEQLGELFLAKDSEALAMRAKA